MWSLSRSSLVLTTVIVSVSLSSSAIGISLSASTSGLSIKKTATETSEFWRLICGGERLPVVGIRVTVIEVSQTKSWRVIETKTTDEHGRVALATRPYRDAKTEDFILRVSYAYEPAIDQGDETPFLVAHQNETLNEDSALSEELLLDEDVRRSGNVSLTDAPCLAFVNTKRALDDFRTATGKKGHPAGALQVVFSKHIGDTLKAPFAAIDTIQLPVDYRLSYAEALHSLGHTVRQALDGSYAHFLTDLARFQYTRPHSCNRKTNFGFAFNEGWAVYWANSTKCFVSHDWVVRKYNSAKAEYNIEGRVASALSELGARCHGPREHRKRFYDLLEEHPLEVHSFEDFLKLHKKKYSCSLP